MMEVFGPDGMMSPDFLKPGVAGRLLGELVGKSEPYTKQHVLRLWRECKRTVYITPLGKLVHKDDVEFVAKTIAWWRNEPGKGYLGGSPWCAGSGEAHISTNPKGASVTCPVCAWVFTATWVARYSSSGEVVDYVAKVPTHKDRRPQEPSS